MRCSRDGTGRLCLERRRLFINATGSRDCLPLSARVYRDDLSGIRAALRIEHRSQLAHRVERCLVEDGFHVSHLVQADTMLAGYAATRVDARLHDLLHRAMHALALRRIIRAIGNVGVQVAIARVEYIANDDMISVTDLVDRLENLRKLCAGDHSVLHDQVRSETPLCPKGFLAALPQLHSFGFITRDANIARTALVANATNRFQIGGDSRLQTIELDEQDCFRVARIPRRVDRVFDDTNRRTVHELESGRYYSRRNHR